MDWMRMTPMSKKGERNREQWIRLENGNSEQFEVDTYLGKKTDLLALKKNIVEKLKKNQAYYKESRTGIYKPKNTEPVSSCPVCNESSIKTELKVNIYGAKYAMCNKCTHVYVLERPSKSAIEGFYLNDITYAATYTDKQAAESRLNAIAVPWLKWTLEVFENTHGRKPTKILDVGSGAGHFVEACRREGIEAQGIELSQSSRDFSKEIWEIELDARDFLKVGSDYDGYDIVTFWGLLEHTPNPSAILEKAYDIVSKSDAGMVISKLPRWHSLSSAIQQLSTDTVIRHLDPMGHIMAFTDASASELYYKNKFKPAAAWYYGMDVYETLMQISTKTEAYDAFTKTGPVQMELQQFVDENIFSDGITLAGVPFKS